MESMSQKLSSITLLAALVCGVAGAKTEKWYVQALQVPLRAAPGFQAAPVAGLKRGMVFTVQRRQGTWVYGSAARKTGWISRLFLSRQKPIGLADLNNKLSDDTLEKTNRRRPHSYAVSAATRGLLVKVPRKGDMYKADYSALQYVESFQLSSQKLRWFQETGNLNVIQ